MIASPESIPTAIHLRKTLVNHRPKFPITGLVHFGEHPSLESAVSVVIDAWLRKCTDPTSSCLPHFRAILHILHLRVTHIISHSRQRPQGPLEEILRTQEAIFQFRLLLDTNFAYNPDCSLELIEVFVELEFHIRQQRISLSTPQLFESKTYKHFPSITPECIVVSGQYQPANDGTYGL